MKKIIYSALLMFATMLTVSACTEDDVQPSVENTHGGGGSGSTGEIKP